MDGQHDSTTKDRVDITFLCFVSVEVAVSDETQRFASLNGNDADNGL